MKLGPTGKFPDGQIDESDEGGLEIAIVKDEDGKNIIIHFGTPTIWVGIPPEAAIEIANKILELARSMQTKN